MTTATAAALDADAIARIGDHHDEPDWLRASRASWWERAMQTPPPTGQEEEWRRTDLAGLPRDGRLLMDVPRLEITLPAGAAEAGVILEDLRDAVPEHPELVRRALGQEDGPASHAHYWALAHAAWTGNGGAPLAAARDYIETFPRDVTTALLRKALTDGDFLAKSVAPLATIPTRPGSSGPFMLWDTHSAPPRSRSRPFRPVRPAHVAG